MTSNSWRHNLQSRRFGWCQAEGYRKWRSVPPALEARGKDFFSLTLASRHYDSRLSFTERYGSLLPGCRSVPFVWHAVHHAIMHLRSSFTDQFDVRQSQCSTVRDRSFAVAGVQLGLWNSLPPIIVACDTLSRFRRELNFYVDSHIPLFCFSFLRGPCGF